MQNSLFQIQSFTSTGVEEILVLAKIVEVVHTKCTSNESLNFGSQFRLLEEEKLML